MSVYHTHFCSACGKELVHPNPAAAPVDEVDHNESVLGGTCGLASQIFESALKTFGDHLRIHHPKQRIRRSYAGWEVLFK